MVNTNYVPLWLISPFQHVHYTLVRNQLHMDLLFEDMNKVDQFLSIEGLQLRLISIPKVHMQLFSLVILQKEIRLKCMDCFYMKLFMSGKRLKAHG